MSKFTIYLLSLTFVISCFAQDKGQVPECGEKVKLEGEFFYKKRDKKTKEVVTHSQREEVKKSWEGNDQSFENIYIKGIPAVSVNVISPYSKKSYILEKTEKGLIIKNHSHAKEVLAKAKPFTLTYQIHSKNKDKCNYSIKIIKGD